MRDFDDNIWYHVWFNLVIDGADVISSCCCCCHLIYIYIYLFIMNDDFSMVQIGKQDDHGGTGDTPILGCLGMLGMVGIDVLLGYGKPDGHALLGFILPCFFCSPACLQSYGTGLGKCMKMYGFYRFLGFWSLEKFVSVGDMISP